MVIKNFLKRIDSKTLDSVYLMQDKRRVRRTQNLNLIPELPDRRGGKVAYGEWCHVVGIFQALIAVYAPSNESLTLLDIGCGTGLLAIATQPLLGPQGRYIGIDVSQRDINFCQQHYPAKWASFQHLDVANPTYAPNQSVEKVPWDIRDGSVDILTALSVWTHMNEADALFYFKEIDRVLKPGGRAILTFFVLDEAYRASLTHRKKQVSSYHNTYENRWIFDQVSSPSRQWYHRNGAAHPEDAIAITTEGIAMLLAGTSLVQIAAYCGNWKERPGLYFQDILVFERQNP